ncbi:hypothetical protein KDX04_09970 [Burkholderia cenocepacia]|uniref:hypothetical protein n=1 Tax=Burkholderia cenocepacia TaxID=95486 RepID=UPI001BA14A55|nr:hypothetical protein [Burkholderia cenocepacia]MBR7986151.1 hypothetical protein [Burkholderia cenocepacia]
MSNERFIPAQPGCHAWGVMEVDDRRVAHYCGEVVAWHMEPDDGRLYAARSRFVARPVLLGEWPMGLVVVRDGRLYGDGHEYYSFESWLQSEGLIVMAEDADRARELYGIASELVVGGDGDEDLAADLRPENEAHGESEAESACSGLIADAYAELGVRERVNLSARAALDGQVALT